MRKIEKLNIVYHGFSECYTEEELYMEILGLKNAIKQAELRISTLKQGLQLHRMNTSEEKQNEQNINSPNKENK